MLAVPVAYRPSNRSLHRHRHSPAYATNSLFGTPAVIRAVEATTFDDKQLRRAAIHYGTEAVYTEVVMKASGRKRLALG